MKRREGMTMAEVRAALRDVRKTLADIEARLIRRTPTRRASPKSARMTPRLYDAIREFAAAHPEMAMIDIAANFNVNQGRVSEVLADVVRPEAAQGEAENLQMPLPVTQARTVGPPPHKSPTGDN